MAWIDHSATSPHLDTMYVIWHNGAPAYMNRRTSSGWGTPIKVSGTETTGTAIGSPGHPQGTHVNGNDIDLAYYQVNTANNYLRTHLAYGLGNTYEHVPADPLALGMPVGSIGPTRARCLDHLRRRTGITGLLEGSGA